MVVNHVLWKPSRRSNKLQLVRHREGLIGEDGPGGLQRGGGLPDVTQLCGRTGGGSADLAPVWAKRQQIICDGGGH